MFKNYFLLASALVLSAASLQAQVFITGKSIDKSETSPMTNPVVDVMPPVLNCMQGIQTNFLPTGKVQLWTTDFLASVSDNVTPANQIDLGIRRAGTGTGFPVGSNGHALQSLLFDCTEQGVQQVELWARDQAGNSSHCVTSILLQDNNGACNTSPGSIKVTSSSASECSVEDLEFYVSGVDSLGLPFILHQSGYIANFDVPVGSSGAITVFKDDNPTNGVTTYDWVLIRKHLNGTELLNTPFKIIAADVNKDGALNVQDSIDFYNVILGISPEFPNTPSFRFIPDNYIFQNPANPLAEAFPESYTFTNLQEHLELNFIPIKVGDVNNTFVCNSVDPGNAEDRQLNVNTSAKVFPNPTSAGTTISLHLEAEALTRVQIRDISGNLVLEQNSRLAAGEQQMEIPAAALRQAGIYIWTVLVNGELTSGKLIRL